MKHTTIDIEQLGTPQLVSLLRKRFVEFGEHVEQVFEIELTDTFPHTFGELAQAVYELDSRLGAK